MSGQPQPYIVRNGSFRGRPVSELATDDLRQMVDAIPADEDATAGVRMMHWMLNKGYSAQEFVEFIAWGQNILDTTGKITPADFSPDPGEAPNTHEEREMLRAARPPVMTRRNLLLGVPSALIATYSAARLLLSGLSMLAEEGAEEGALPEKEKGRLAKISEAMESISSAPVEAAGTLMLLYEVIDIYKEYEPEKFDQISNAIAKIADDLGIGDPTPTYRLPPRSAGGRGA